MRNGAAYGTALQGRLVFVKLSLKPNLAPGGPVLTIRHDDDVVRCENADEKREGMTQAGACAFENEFNPILAGALSPITMGCAAPVVECDLEKSGSNGRFV